MTTNWFSIRFFGEIGWKSVPLSSLDPRPNSCVPIHSIGIITQLNLSSNTFCNSAFDRSTNLGDDWACPHASKTHNVQCSSIICAHLLGHTKLTNKQPNSIIEFDILYTTIFKLSSIKFCSKPNGKSPQNSKLAALPLSSLSFYYLVSETLNHDHGGGHSWCCHCFPCLSMHFWKWSMAPLFFSMCSIKKQAFLGRWFKISLKCSLSFTNILMSHRWCVQGRCQVPRLPECSMFPLFYGPLQAIGLWTEVSGYVFRLT